MSVVSMSKHLCVYRPPAWHRSNTRRQGEDEKYYTTFQQLAPPGDGQNGVTGKSTGATLVRIDPVKGASTVFHSTNKIIVT